MPDKFDNQMKWTNVFKTFTKIDTTNENYLKSPLCSIKVGCVILKFFPERTLGPDGLTGDFF